MGLICGNCKYERPNNLKVTDTSCPLCDTPYPTESEKLAIDAAPLPTTTSSLDGLTATKACIFCGETILAVAKKCKHCGSMLDGDELPTVQPNLAAVKGEVFTLTRAGKTVDAIKLYRKGTGVGLKEAKDYVESLSAGAKGIVQQQSNSTSTGLKLFFTIGIIVVIYGLSTCSQPKSVENTKPASAISSTKEAAEAKERATLRSDAVSCSDLGRYLERQGYGYMERIAMQRESRANGMCYWLSDK